MSSTALSLTSLLIICIETGKNPYDARIPCDRQKDGDLCYRQMGWIENWLNSPKVKTTLGVDPDRNFASCNMEVNQAFTANGDGAHNSAALLPDLVNDGVRLLVYAGNADMMCNFIVSFSAKASHNVSRLTVYTCSG